VRGFDGFGPIRELTTPRSSRYRPEGTVVHRCLDYDLAEATVHQGFAVTGVARMLLDIGLKVPIERQADAIDEAIRRRLVDWPELYHVLIAHACRGRDGVGPFRAILDERYGTKVPLSGWSRKFSRLLTQHGLPAPELEYRITTETGLFIAQVDGAYPQARLAIELQSKAFHLNDSAFERDAQRRNRLLRHGWVVFDYTWRYYVEQSLAIVSEVRGHLRDHGLLPAA
jgi:hypothetical protein